jgi:formylglycine-generating enzyme required for sulfatase activity
MQTVETGGVRHVEHWICHRSMALLVLTIIASPALGESPFHDSECALSASSEMAQPLEVATRALPRSPLQPIAGTFPPMRIAKPLSAAEQGALQPRDLFKECEACPEMVVVPAGEFTMGAPETEKGSDSDERPRRRVAFATQFAVGRFAVTFDEWDGCVAQGGCKGYRPSDRSWGRGRQPVINLWWEDARAYVRWISERTLRPYRLLSEAEREYVTRAGTTTPFWWGDSISTEQANYDGDFKYGCGRKGVYRQRTVRVDSFAPNPWGLYQVHGNVYEWVEDCWNRNYEGAPSDGSAWLTGDCARRVMRGGSWQFAPWHLRSAARGAVATAADFRIVGMRIARPLQ